MSLDSLPKELILIIGESFWVAFPLQATSKRYRALFARVPKVGILITCKSRTYSRKILYYWPHKLSYTEENFDHVYFNEGYSIRRGPNKVLLRKQQTETITILPHELQETKSAQYYGKIYTTMSHDESGFFVAYEVQDFIRGQCRIFLPA